MFAGSDFIVNDTVYYRITTTSGSLTAVTENSFVVGKYLFASKHESISLSNETDGYSLENAQYSTANPDIEFVLGAGNQLGFSSATTTFVKSSMESYDDGADVETGDVYIFNIGASGKYGIILFTDVDRINTNDEDSVEFSFIIE